MCVCVDRVEHDLTNSLRTVNIRTFALNQGILYYIFLSGGETKQTAPMLMRGKCILSNYRKRTTDIWIFDMLFYQQPIFQISVVR